MMFSRLPTFLLACLPCTAAAQIIRDHGTSSSSADSTSPIAVGRFAQADFERFRVEHLPRASSPRPSNCDETVGRFCYWYAETRLPKEPQSITERRDRLVALFDSLAKAAPDDRWISGQRVRYLAESEKYGAALRAAHECGVGGWWCDILVGFSLHLLGEYSAADSVYDRAISQMLPRDQCEWRSIELLLDEDARQQYRRYPCGDPQRTAYENEAWFLARTLYSMRGNDSRTEHYARMTMTLILKDAPSAYQYGLDDDERELLLRFGWNRAWASEGTDRRTGVQQIVGMEAVPAYRYIPPAFVLNNPPLSDSANWRLQLPPVIGRYAPPYALHLKPLEHQKAMFKRGDSALVVLAYDSRTMKEMAGLSIDAALVIAAGDKPRAWMKTLHNAPPEGVLVATAPWGPLLMSAEVTARDKHAVARARYGVQPPYAIGTRVTLSDLLFYKPYGAFPQSVEEAAPHAHSTERLRSDAKLGVYWEAYGTDPSGETMKVSLTVEQEVEEAGFLRRQAKALKLIRKATPVSISVTDISARDAKVSPRALELDISTLTKGSYIVQLEIEVAGQYVVRADHRIEIIGP
ncbi:MAG TPA: hypothetical protein VHE78_08735 [Gemmatimonadaceae bacterium]|nr:hypothetical protein [Gemmatimonadaceae bacterium]